MQNTHGTVQYSTVSTVQYSLRTVQLGGTNVAAPSTETGARALNLIGALGAFLEAVGWYDVMFKHKILKFEINTVACSE